MQLPTTYAKEDSTICVSVPPTRSDVLHPCDVMEDVGIAFGYNEIPKRKPVSLKPLPLNERSDLIRLEISSKGKHTHPLSAIRAAAVTYRWRPVHQQNTGSSG
ncbi:hypothetical protein Ancab_032134 [Ancistrocladus abbreviatus]